MKQILTLVILFILIACGQTERKKIVTFYENGNPEIVHYIADENDTLTYRKECYYESGKQMYTGHLVKDIKDGVWTWWYENGNKKDECTYKNGFYKDTVYHWYESGELKQIEIVAESKVSADNCCNCNGTVIRYYKSGKTQEVRRSISDKLQGAYEVYDSNGGWKTRTYKDDTLWGPTTEHNIDSNGLTIVTGQYERGKETGLWKWFDKDSILYQTGVYKNGVATGPYLKYYPNGQLKEKAVLVDGQYEGECIYFDEKGNITKTEFYKSGELQRTRKK